MSVIVFTIKLHCLCIWMHMIFSILIWHRSIYCGNSRFALPTVKTLTGRASQSLMSMMVTIIWLLFSWSIPSIFMIILLPLSLHLGSITAFIISMLISDRCVRNNSGILHMVFAIMTMATISDCILLDSKSTNFSGTHWIFSPCCDVVGTYIHPVWRSLCIF